MALLRCGPNIFFPLHKAMVFEAFAKIWIGSRTVTNPAKRHPFAVSQFPPLGLTENRFHGATSICKGNLTGERGL
jgi:hypothetical protein